MKKDVYDIAIFGGGINGTSVARDAAGRKLSVALFEMEDIGWATSSASTKLLHGGLRYLEYFQFRLVKEALNEREILFDTAPHIAWRKRFILPYKRAFFMPKFAVRTGLFLYDHLAKLRNLQKSKGVDLRTHKAGLDLNLKGKSKKGYEYSDLGTLDTKFCVLNAVDAKKNGADIFTRTKVLNAVRENGIWIIEVMNVKTKKKSTIKAKTIVNTTGPWMNEVIKDVLPIEAKGKVTLVQGSHIIVPKMFEHEYGYFLQTDTKRIIFALPYEGDFTMIGTTDTDYEGDPSRVKATKEEKEYLINIINKWFKVQLKTSDIVWDFSGVRALYADGKDATSATRDYVIKIDTDENNQAAVLNLFGGKITAAREIGEKLMNMLAPVIGIEKSVWTRTTPLYGGDFKGKTYEQYVYNMMTKYKWVQQAHMERLVRHYGTYTNTILGSSKKYKDLGKHFGYNLYEAEIKYMIKEEFAETMEDVVWRRTRIGLHMTEEEIKSVTKYMKTKVK